MNEESPGLEYQPLEELINFEDFDFGRWRTGEVEKLQPQLEKLGYTDILWLPGETDSFGPLTRVCKTKNSSGEVVWFIYG